MQYRVASLTRFVPTVLTSFGFLEVSVKYLAILLKMVYLFGILNLQNVACDYIPE